MPEIKARMIVTFSNRKGGVGKSSLCVSLANYWSSQDIPVRVTDTDPQQSLLIAREIDMKKEITLQPKFDIQRFELYNELNKLPDYIRQLKQSGSHILFDVPGGMGNDLYMHIVLFSDFVIVPFQYEDFSIESTGEYATVLKKLGEAYPTLKREVIFVPNMVDTRIGRAADRQRWDAWDRDIDSVAIRSPRVPLRVCLQRRNTLFQTLEELSCVSPCFEFITSLVFKK